MILSFARAMPRTPEEAAGAGMTFYDARAMPTEPKKPEDRWHDYIQCTSYASGPQEA